MSTSELTALRPDSLTATNLDFDIETYLQQRCQDPSFIMLEFGHGCSPAAYRQPLGFTEQRAYIGVEAWLRDRESSAWATLESKRAEHPDQNIIYIEQDLDTSGTNVQHKLSSLVRKLGFVGLYDPSTVLPDESADEIFLSNVFGDPVIAYPKRRTRRLIDEVSRLTSKEGVVVIRETITPDKAKNSLTNAVLQNAGLQIAMFCTPEDRVWGRLERIYGAGKKYNLSPNFYQFLTKVTDS